MSTRIRQVAVGRYKLGDELDGHIITGFGRSWKLDEEESCAYGAGPWERVEVCYAYGEKKDAAPVQMPHVNRMSDKAAAAKERRAEAWREEQAEAAKSRLEKAEDALRVHMAVEPYWNRPEHRRIWEEKHAELKAEVARLGGSSVGESTPRN